MGADTGNKGPHPHKSESLRYITFIETFSLRLFYFFPLNIDHKQTWHSARAREHARGRFVEDCGRIWGI